MPRSSNDDIAKSSLKRKIVRSLKEQGFVVKKNQIYPPDAAEKNSIRSLHSKAVQHRIDKASPRLKAKEKHLLNFIANGNDIDPFHIAPRLIEVKKNSQYEYLFRYVSLHWSIPVSSGYGRRLRFVVIDENNGKLIGIIGLGDPVFSLASRDNWIGWSFATRREKLRYVMDAFVLGAVPPYSMMLFGKFIAMLVCSEEVNSLLCKKYFGSLSYISKRQSDSRLALVTTTSALGKSSVYNRLNLKHGLSYISVGFTGGWGDFHFANGLYSRIFEFVSNNSKPTAKQKDWGYGFRNRREVIRKCLSMIELSDDYLNHGIAREIFVVPLAKNTRQFLNGKHSHLYRYRYSTDEIFACFKDRWMLSRIKWDDRFKSYNRKNYAILQNSN